MHLLSSTVASSSRSVPVLQAAEELQDFLQQVQAARQKPLGSKPSPVSWLAGNAHSQRVLAVLAYGLDEADTAQTKLAIDTMHVSPDLDSCSASCWGSPVAFWCRGVAQTDCLKSIMANSQKQVWSRQGTSARCTRSGAGQPVDLLGAQGGVAFSLPGRGLPDACALQAATVPCRRWAGRPAWGRRWTCCRTWVCGASTSSAASSRLAWSSTSPLKLW